jgi:hypothetical protein
MQSINFASMKKIELTEAEVINRIKFANFGVVEATKPHTTTLQHLYEIHREYSQEEVGAVIKNMNVVLKGGLSDNIAFSSEYFK